MRNTREVLRLKFEVALSHREVSTSLGLSPGTVGKTLSRLEAPGLTWAAAQALSEEALETKLYAAATAAPTRPLPDYARGDAQASDDFVRYTRGIPDGRLTLLRDARAYEIGRAAMTMPTWGRTRSGGGPLFTSTPGSVLASGEDGAERVAAAAAGRGRGDRPRGLRLLRGGGVTLPDTALVPRCTDTRRVQEPTHDDRPVGSRKVRPGGAGAGRAFRVAGPNARLTPPRAITRRPHPVPSPPCRSISSARAPASWPA